MVFFMICDGVLLFEVWIMLVVFLFLFEMEKSWVKLLFELCCKMGGF